jgi:uncharacterized protein YjbI with pentapeptide repeats
MNDETRLSVDDAETPVNPYSLLTAVNAASARANTAWLIYLALLALVFVAVAGVTHRDLLLASDITLPVLGVKISLTRFFLLAPVLVVLLHLGLLGQLVALTRKTLEFSSALSMLETSDRHTHPLRLSLDNFFFVQAMAGPERSRAVSAFLNGMSWITLVLLPVALLLYIQLTFLPFHDAGITLAHRLALFADIAVLVLFGVFLLSHETGYFAALLRAGIYNPGSLAAGIVLLAAATAFSLLLATVPDATEREARAGMFTTADGALLGFFPRNLDAADVDFVPDSSVGAGAVSVNLRGRDLRFAKLDRADLHQADLTGANLDGASLVGADLRQALLQCAEADPQRVAENREGARCVSARGTNLAKARLGEAKMSGIDLRGALLEEAEMQGALLRYALMAGAKLSHANLERADLSGGTQLQGVNLVEADLQGADLSGARLQMADMRGASMRGANLSAANLEGSVLRDTDLEGATLQMAKLFGADMQGAKLGLADLSRALVWRTVPPAADSTALADLASLVIKAPSEEEMGHTRSAVAALDPGPLKVRLANLMAPMNDAGPNSGWASSPEGQAWASLAKAGDPATAEGYRARLTEQLARLACRTRTAGGVARGIARRALSAGFKGDVALLYERLRAPDCGVSATLPPRTLADLATAAEAAKAQ